MQYLRHRMNFVYKLDLKVIWPKLRNYFVFTSEFSYLLSLSNPSSSGSGFKFQKKIHLHPARSTVSYTFHLRFLYLGKVSITFGIPLEFREKMKCTCVFFSFGMLKRGKGQSRKSRDKFTWMLATVTLWTFMNSNNLW